ncbi:nucleoside-diphosphate sugar epimerase/dehydratase [Flavobacterium sp.]|uniref:polysaccharide biosynthesis protein n=1 Tax=Flavobacterium sp. TaxID=239 RepID=UPI0034503BAF
MDKKLQDKEKTGFSTFFSEINFDFALKNLAYLPRWIILFIDIAIIAFSTLLTYVLLKGLKLDYFQTTHIVIALLFLLAVNTIYFWFFRTYSGIIRHSSNIDAIKLLFSQSATFGTLLFLNFVFILLKIQKPYLTTGLIINLIFSFSFLFLYRMMVKYIFEKYFTEMSKTKKMKALIYGSDANAIAVANALSSESPGKFNLVGFVDKSNQNSSKRILGLPILKIRKTIPVLMRSMNIEALIFADNSLSKNDKSVIIEECIEYNFKVFTVPTISDWEDQKEITKSIKNIEIQDLLERKPIVLDTNSISSKLKGKCILVTGAAGSIGSEIVRQVLKFNPDTLIILDQAETPLHSLSLEIIGLKENVNIKNVIADVRNLESLEKIFKEYKPEVVYHAAAYKHVPMMEENPAQAIFTNVLGTKNLADLSHKYKVERFVMISTDKAVNPSSVMGASKRIAEMYVQSKHFKHKKLGSEHQTKFITTRFGNVLGSNGSVVPLFTKQIQEGGPITITHPEIIRYFMTIPEACQLVLEACSMGNGGEIFIFDMGKPVKIIDLARKMIRLAGFKPDTDIEIKIVGLRPGEKLYEELLNNTAKNLPTHHEKIMIAEEICDEFVVVNNAIQELIVVSNDSNGELIVAKMKNLVPEFKSLNSVFESLDIEVKDSYVYTK